MEEQKRSGDGVEGLVLERDGHDVTADELDAGHMLARELEHDVGAVEAHGLRSACHSTPGDIPGAGRQIEEPRSGAGVDRIQQRLGEPLGDAPEQHVVGIDVLLRPAGCLERVERRQVIAHRSGPPIPGNPSGGAGAAIVSEARLPPRLDTADQIGDLGAADSRSDAAARLDE